MRSSYIITIFWALVTLVPIAGIFVSLIDPIQFSSVQRMVEQRVTEDFWGAASLFIAVQALQVVITPISHYSIGYLGGVSFGLFWGTTLNYIGRVIGHLSAFWLARRFGRNLIMRYVPAEDILKYDRWLGSAPHALALIYFLPFFPDDEISYLIGLSAMPLRWFIPALLIGQVGGSLGLACLGSGVKTHTGTFWGVLVATIIGAFWLWRISRRQNRVSTRV